MKHWTQAGIGSAQSEVQGLIRFNEAIDQAIADSIHEYSKAVGRYRDMFLVVLGHDERGLTSCGREGDHERKGLGLYIARRMAEAHGGAATAPAAMGLTYQLILI